MVRAMALTAHGVTHLKIIGCWTVLTDPVHR
jgi:hypothetical protein